MGIRIGGGVGPFYASVGTSRRTASGGDGALVALFIVLAVVGTAIWYAAKYWYITVPVLVVAVCIALLVAAKKRTDTTNVDPRANAIAAERTRVAEERAALTIPEMKERVSALRSQLGGDFPDFIRAARFVITERRAGRDRVRLGLGITGRRAAELLTMLEDAGVVSAPRQSYRNILPIEFAPCFAFPEAAPES